MNYWSTGEIIASKNLLHECKTRKQLCITGKVSFPYNLISMKHMYTVKCVTMLQSGVIGVEATEKDLLRWGARQLPLP